MAILLKVHWVDKTEDAGSFQRVRHIGGSTRALRWKHSQAEAIRAIEKGEFTYYMEKETLVFELLVGTSSDGQKYLKTKADTDHPHQLASVPAFPADRATAGVRP
jgi:hypothetical protein